MESLTQAVCDLALRFGETGTGDKTILVSRVAALLALRVCL